VGLCLLAGFGLQGCGGHGASAANEPWRSNATGALKQLIGDVALTATGGGTAAEARRALGSDSDVFVLLFAYSDLGGCTAMIRHTGAPQELLPALTRPCPGLERAAASFTRATSRHDPAALLRAARLARQAQPELVQALLAARSGR
jgi:hypothetical protein